jgi:AcrR family transcriptional regulator
MATTIGGSVRRRGRPPAAERGLRRDAALDAALAEIHHNGFERLTMSAVAARAGSSKESLYVWFGNKEGLVAELIRRQSARTNTAVESALTTNQPVHEVLVGIASNLLNVLLGDTSLALNRAAMSSPTLAAILLQQGRHTTGPLIERYLARLHQEGLIQIDDPAEAFCLFYGLAFQDSQIRALLGEPPPDAAARSRMARSAVIRFIALAAPLQDVADPQKAVAVERDFS